MRTRLHDMLDGALELPGLAGWRRRRFDAAFASGHYGGHFRGVHRTRAACEAAMPTTTLPAGYDNAGMAAMYRDRLDRVYPGDYPMLMWLGKAFAAGATRVFDLGGHVGVAYYAYRRYLDYPAALSWQVHDVPAVMAAGRALAAERDTWKQLSFVEDAGAAADADVLFTSGCIQYLDETLGERIAKLPRRPRWVLVNLLPLHATEAYWTLQSTGRALCPYRIQRKPDFLAEFERLGYEMPDLWENAEKRCTIAFDEAHSLDRYYGMVFRLR
ncbi:MAG: methyltransferase, TIGR04325 family [Vitreoscilla sp.]|jgi:putative methyltransferase (TIGR04325 family)